MRMELSNELQSIGLLVGRIVEVAEHVGARAPSYLLTIDLGPAGPRECTMPRADYEPEELEGTQVVCAARGEELLVLAAHSHAKGVVLVRPDRAVEAGSAVG
jgi:tRNA-binding EMAP/Myf-like protein